MAELRLLLELPEMSLEAEELPESDPLAPLDPMVPLAPPGAVEPVAPLGPEAPLLPEAPELPVLEPWAYKPPVSASVAMITAIFFMIVFSFL